jgi:ferredoxin
MAEFAKVDCDLCTACGACIDVCPTEAIAMNGDETCAVVDPGLCTACGACVDECPTGAIELKED